jgi:type IV secretion system protein VirB11
MITTSHPYLARTAGPLLPFLQAPLIRELRCTSAGRVFTIHSDEGKQRQADVSPKVLDSFLSLIADLVGAEWRASSPRLHAASVELGIRIQAGRPPISDGPWMVCRKHPQRVYPLDDFGRKGILTHHQAAREERYFQPRATVQATLEAALAERKTIVISGAVGSAKTSLTNALLDHLASTKDRIVILEDDQELRSGAEEVQTIRTWDGDHTTPPITMRDLGKDLLRISPDRIVVGEVRDGAALDMLKAFQCGMPGLCTVHAPSAIETLTRLEQLVQEVSVDPQKHLIGEAIDVVIHMMQYGQSWRVTDLIAVEGFDGQHYVTRSLLP